MTRPKAKHPATTKMPKRPITAKVFTNAVLSPLHNSWKEFLAGGSGFTADFIEAVLNNGDLPALDDRALFD
jgi:hypothetical protein